MTLSLNNFFDQLITGLTKKSPIYIKVKVIPNALKNDIIDQMADETYKIQVTAPPLQGKANEALCRFLKKSLHASDVSIVSGSKSKIKLIRINA